MMTPELLSGLPSTEELPCSDDTPVDNEDQNSLPNLLLFMLANLWAERRDWYFGVDMAVYHTTGDNPRIPVVPDAFLSVGVERRKGGRSRRSYATWEENGVVPILVLEMVSHQPGGEYDSKFAIYQQLGVLYYVIYNPEFWRRDRHQPFEVYQLVEGKYQLVFSTAEADRPYYFGELGLGFRQQPLGGIEQEILAWYDAQGHVYPTPDEVRVQLRQQQQALAAERQRAEAERQRAEAERQRAEQAEQQAAAERQRAESERQRAEQAEQRAAAERRRAEQLVQYLRSLGLGPDNLPDR